MNSNRVGESLEDELTLYQRLDDFGKKNIKSLLLGIGVGIFVGVVSPYSNETDARAFYVYFGGACALSIPIAHTISDRLFYREKSFLTKVAGSPLPQGGG